MRGHQEPCGEFRPTMKPSYCCCGFRREDHEESAIGPSEWKWGWRSRVLAQPDREDCE